MSTVGRSTMIALALGQALVSLDASVVNVALPKIQETLGSTSSQMQLIVVAYMIALAALVLPIGALSDRIGRRPVYLFGLLGFAIGSLLCGLAWSNEVLIAARGIQGAGAACLMGLALAILTDNVPRDRIPKVVALWTTVSISAMAAGPFVGGVLVTVLGWRSVFLINVPLILGVYLVARKVLVDDRRSGEGPVGFVGAALLVGVLGLGTLGLTALEHGPVTQPRAFIPLIVAAILLVILVIQQRRSVAPLVHWSIMRIAPMPATLTLALLLALALSGALYQMSIFTQNVLGFTPAMAGGVMLAASLSMAVLAPMAPRIQRRLGTALPVCLSMVVAAVGMLILAKLGPSSTTMIVIIGLFVLGVGLAIATPLVSAVAMQQGTGGSGGAMSGTLGLVGQVAGVLGIVIMGGLTTVMAINQWQAGGGDPALDTAVGVGDVASITSTAGAQAGELASAAYASGVEMAFTVGAVIIGVAALVALFALPRTRPAKPEPLPVETA